MRGQASLAARLCAAAPAAALALLVLLAEPTAGHAAPREITPAERRAVELALAYHQGGAAAWWDALAEEAPLRALGRETALAEIEVRAGPARGSTWRLRTPGTLHGGDTAIFSLELPSGLEETLVLELTRTGTSGGWRLAHVRSLADPAPALAPLPGAAQAGGSALGSPPRRPPFAGPLAAFAAAALLAALAAATVRRRALGAGLAAAALALAVVPLFQACRGAPTETAEPDLEAPAEAGGAVEPERLAALLPLRQALFASDEAEIERLAADLPEEPRLAEVTRLWLAQDRLRRFDLNQAEVLLERAASKRPLASLLRARLALQRGDETAASTAYDWALEIGPDHDGLRLESAEALVLLGLWGEAEVVYRLAAEAGSREAETYYTLASFEVLNQKQRESEELFRTAWELLPVSRETLFDDPMLATVSASPMLFPLFEFSSPEEPRVAYDGPRLTALELADGVEAVTSGAFLRLATGAGTLLVPGGAALAPTTTPVEDAGAEARREAEAALARVPALLARVREGESLNPLDRNLEGAVSALAAETRWDEALELTAGIESAVDRARPQLVKLRARALLERERTKEARELLVSLAESDRANRRKDPGTFFQLAELFAASAEYDLAVRSLRKANLLTPGLANFSRIRQIEMEQRLVGDSSQYRTTNFEIRYPRLTGERYAGDLGTVLEAEWKRLQRWIPVRAPQRVDVDLYPVLEFLEAYSTVSLVVGIFDGRLRVPFADLHSLHPELVSILSHELAHAMIAIRTRDRAPKWFHEGLAQHVQMVQDVLNPIPDLHATSRVLSLPVVEAVLAGFSEPRFIELAYGEAAWAVHFIEARYGVAGIHRMLDAFAAGLTTEAALERAFGLSMAEFDRAAWAWCLEQAPTTWPTEVRRYDREMEGLIRTASGQQPQARPGRPAPRSGSGGLSLAAAMPRWHRTYAARVSAVKGALGPVARMAKGKQTWDDGTACRTLGERLDGLFASNALAAPDPEVARPLESAFRSLQAMVGSCLEGRRQELARHLAAAERSLGQAAKALGHYGLRP